jgi:eukaryotic-like serine/threonine-protein kinase
MTTHGEALRDVGGRYRLGRMVGRGATAEVWVATDERLGRDVAIKLFRTDVPDPGAQARIEAEMRTLAALRHPGLVTVYDAGLAGGGASPYLVMELVDGQTLHERLALGPLTGAETAALGIALADALAYVHGMGVVHRDVKPANILLEGPGPAWTAVKLADFGIARIDDAPRLTADGTTLGTPNYLSPEQVRGSDVGPAGDVYSLGLVLLECLTGVMAYTGQSVEAAVARLSRDPDIPPHLDAGWRSLLAAMTSREQDGRPTAAEVAAQLRALPVPAAATGQTTVLTAAPGEMPTPAASGATKLLAAKPRRRRRPLLVLGALVVLLIAVAAVLVLTQSDGSGSSRTPPPHYPSVPGRMGAHLVQLEGAIG